jgi:hypothetical protein
MSSLLRMILCQKFYGLAWHGWLAGRRSWMELDGFDQRIKPCCYVVRTRDLTPKLRSTFGGNYEDDK